MTALLLLVGVFALALPDLISGLLDERRGSLGAVRDGVEALNAVSFVGGLLVGLAVVLFVINLAVSLASRTEQRCRRSVGRPDARMGRRPGRRHRRSRPRRCSMPKEAAEGGAA